MMLTDPMTLPAGTADSKPRKSTRMASIRAVSGKKHQRAQRSQLPRKEDSTELTDLPKQEVPAPRIYAAPSSLAVPKSQPSSRRPPLSTDRLRVSNLPSSNRPVVLSASQLSTDTSNATAKSDLRQILNNYNDVTVLKRKKRSRKKRVTMDGSTDGKPYHIPTTLEKIHPKKPKLKPRPSALDLNNPYIEIKKPEYPANKKFSDIARTAILVRNWVMSVQDPEDTGNNRAAEDVHENLIFEPPPPATANDAQPILPRDEIDDNQNQAIQRLGGWEIIAKYFKDRWRRVIYFYISPGSALAYYWNALVSIGIFYNMLAMVIFVFDDVFRYFYRPWLGTNLFFDFIYLLDIFVQSRTTYIHDGSEVKQTEMTTKNYLHSPRLILDLLALFPLDLVLFLNPAISIIRLVRLFKAYRLMDFISTTQKRTNFPHGAKIFMLFCACYILFHWNACMYFLYSIFVGFGDDNSGTFVFNYYKVLNPIFPKCNVYEDENCLYKEPQLDRPDPYESRLQMAAILEDYWTKKSVEWHLGNFSREYSMSMYWSSLTLTACGQQPYPSSSAQNILAVLDTLIGVLVFATIIGGVGSVVTQMNQATYNFRDGLDRIKFYMKYRIVNSDIQERVLQAFMYMNSQNQLTDEAEILEPLPPRLQGQIAVNLHLETLRKVELFKECDVGFLYEIVRKIKQQVYSPNDYLCRMGEKAKEMFIVKRGLLCVVRDEDGFIMETLRDGATFGELSVIHIRGNQLGDRRTVSLRSVGYSDVYILNQDDVSAILQEYPKDREALLRTARQMLEARGLLDEEAIAAAAADGAASLLADDEATFAILSVDEQLARLRGVVGNLESQINNLYTSFNDLSSNMKQRVTKLEDIYRINRQQIKKDCLRSII